MADLSRAPPDEVRGHPLEVRVCLAGDVGPGLAPRRRGGG